MAVTLRGSWAGSDVDLGAERFPGATRLERTKRAMRAPDLLQRRVGIGKQHGPADVHEIPNYHQQDDCAGKGVEAGPGPIAMLKATLKESLLDVVTG